MLIYPGYVQGWCKIYSYYHIRYKKGLVIIFQKTKTSSRSCWWIYCARANVMCFVDTKASYAEELVFRTSGNRLRYLNKCVSLILLYQLCVIPLYTPSYTSSYTPSYTFIFTFILIALSMCTCGIFSTTVIIITYWILTLISCYNESVCGR